MKLNLKNLAKAAEAEYWPQKYKEFCKDVLGFQMYIDYLKSEEGQAMVGENLALDKLARVEEQLKTVKAEKEYLEKLLAK